MSRLFVVGIALVIAGPTLAWTVPPSLDDPMREARLGWLLDDIQTKSALTAFVGHEPLRCRASGPEREVCEWWVDGRDPGHAPLSDAIRDRSKLNLVCEVPLADGVRTRGSCGVRARRSNRDEWPRLFGNVYYVSQAGGGSSRGWGIYSEVAGEWIESARTLGELSRMMGALPDECDEVEPEAWSCLWRTDRHTYGHGTVAAWIGAPMSKKVRFWCRVPRDGSARSQGSCQAEIGD